MVKSNIKSKMKKILIYIILLGFAFSIKAQSDITFNRLDSLYAYANRNSAVAKSNYQQILLAKYQKIAALANIINLRNPISFSSTDNTTLPVSFFPGGILPGTPPGTFVKVTLGQQYVNNFNVLHQIDIINPGNWAQIKKANVNAQLT